MIHCYWTCFDLSRVWEAAMESVPQLIVVIEPLVPPDEDA